MSRKTEAAVAIIAVHGGGLDVERGLRVLSDRGCTLQPSPEGGSDCGLLHVGCDRGCMSGKTEATVGSPPSTGEALILLQFIACRNIDRGCTTQPSPGGLCLRFIACPARTEANVPSPFSSRGWRGSPRRGAMGSFQQPKLLGARDRRSAEAASKCVARNPPSYADVQ